MKQFDDCIYFALHFMSVIWEQLQIMYVYYRNSKNDTIYITPMCIMRMQSSNCFIKFIIECSLKIDLWWCPYHIYSALMPQEPLPLNVKWNLIFNDDYIILHRNMNCGSHNGHYGWNWIEKSCWTMPVSYISIQIT
jgi:uncharacterized membrane protein YhdT